MCLANPNNPPVYSFPAFFELSLKAFLCCSDTASNANPTKYDIELNAKSAEAPLSSAAVRREGVNAIAAVVKLRIEFAELNTVLNTEIRIALAGGISSFDTKTTQYDCLMLEPAAMARMRRGLSGRPSAIAEAKLGGWETLRVLRRGPARPWASMPYWKKISAVRSPTMREVPSGLER